MKQIISFLQHEFTSRHHTENARTMAAYMKTTMPFYGIRAPERRAILKQALKQHPITDRAAYTEIITQLWSLGHREEKYSAVDIARSHARHLQPSMLPLFEMMIRTGAWWDFVDDIAMHIVGKLLLSYPDLMWPIIERWSQDENIWIRRTAIICQNRFKDTTDTQRLFAFCVYNMHDKDFFIRKAIGWALREYAKTDSDAVAHFVTMYKKDLSALSYKEATKHMQILS